jgi:hypothetical protein
MFHSQCSFAVLHLCVWSIGLRSNDSLPVVADEAGLGETVQSILIVRDINGKLLLVERRHTVRLSAGVVRSIFCAWGELLGVNVITLGFLSSLFSSLCVLSSTRFIHFVISIPTILSHSTNQGVLKHVH